MDTETVIENQVEGADVNAADNELVEFVGVDAVRFDDSISRIENLLAGQLVGLALVAGAVMTLLIVRFFHVR